MKLSNKYSYDPVSAFDAIQKEFSLIKENLAELQEQLSGLLDGNGPLPPSIATRWEYEVAQPVYFSDNLYGLEESGGKKKRWVGPAPELDLRLRLRRDISYVVEIDIVDSFPKTMFQTLVDGLDTESVIDGHTLRFSAPPNEAAFARGDGLHLSVRIDEEQLRVPAEGDADNRTLAFSISAIRVHSEDI